MRRTLTVATCAIVILACGDSSGPGDRVFPVGTYDLAVPFNGMSAWPAPVPLAGQGGSGCGEFTGGSIAIDADGDVVAHRTFRQGQATQEQALTGTAHFQDGVLGFLIDYGPFEEHAHAEQEGAVTALYVGHIFPAGAGCAQTTAAVRYVRRQ